MKKIAFALFAIGVMACNSPQPETTETPSAPEVLTFGEGISLDEVMPVNDFMAQLTANDSIENVLISGTINSCCQKKGCWMKVDIGEGREMMVRFKDYGFFMPMDCSGSTARLQGRAFKETLSVDDLRHYAEDAGKTPEEIAAITQPEVRYSFEASGVELVGYTPAEQPETDSENTESSNEEEKQG